MVQFGVRNEEMQSKEVLNSTLDFKGFQQDSTDSKNRNRKIRAK